MFDKFKDECGIFGVFDLNEAAAHIALGLHALQHRGQEAAGIVTYNGAHFHAHKEQGLVGDIFGSEQVMSRLPGKMGIGHVRYSTTGGNLFRNIQPLFADLASGGFALAHNGNLTNAFSVRQDLIKQGSLFQSTSDTEVIIHLLALSKGKTITDRFIEALLQIEGAYALVALTEDTLMGVRDPNGVRPLVLGELDGAYIFASETCALDIIGARHVRDVEPGELVIINKDGIQSLRPLRQTSKRFCIFEYVYFARPDSMVEGGNVYDIRKKIGAELAKESPVDADIVVPVPDSGVPSAMGYASQSGIPFELGIIRNHYIGRTFIEPSDHIRHLGVKLKHNANRAKIEGKKVILVDDSIVRGTTSKKIVDMVRNAGATEVHLRISSPPTTNPCFYGVDTPNKEQLLAHCMDLKGMAEYIGADSLAFVSIDGLYRAVGQKSRDKDSPQFCDACFTGEYPIALTDAKGGQLTLLNEKC